MIVPVARERDDVARLEFSRGSIVPDKLTDELVAAGVDVVRVTYDDAKVWLEVGDAAANVKAAKAAVAAHDPTPEPDPPSLTERIADAAAAAVEAVIPALAPNATAAQRTAAVEHARAAALDAAEG